MLKSDTITISSDWKQKFPVPEELLTYTDAMFQLAPDSCKVVVEIGSQWGHWAFRACRVLPEATVYSIDPWPDPIDKPRLKKIPRIGWDKGDDNFREWLVNLKQYVDVGRAIAIRKTSEEASKSFNLPIDFLFIDGDHFTQGVLTDLRCWVPKVRKGGLIVGHDYDDKNWGPKIQAALNVFWPKKGEYKVAKLYFPFATAPGGCFWKRIE